MDRAAGGFELLDHTADVLLLGRGCDWPELFCQMGHGLMACIGQLRTHEDDARTAELRLTAEDAPNLLHDWLAELLYNFETRRLVFRRAAFDRLEATSLQGRVVSARLELAGSRLLREVKAVTYHQLRIERSPTGWQAMVVLDI
jgi:SHS2 domain-containing protein